MHSTQISFIRKLTTGEQKAWEELNQDYRPLIRKWLRKYQLQDCDVEDLTQEVMAVLFRSMDEFRHNGRVGAFRNWLRTTSVNITRNYLRRANIPQATGLSVFQQRLLQLEDPNSQASAEFDREHDRMVIRRLLANISKQFEPITLEIFQMHVVAGVPATETAKQLNVSTASVHTAKSRVMRQLRRVAADELGEVA